MRNCLRWKIFKNRIFFSQLLLFCDVGNSNDCTFMGCDERVVGHISSILEKFAGNLEENFLESCWISLVFEFVMSFGNFIGNTITIKISCVLHCTVTISPTLATLYELSQGFSFPVKTTRQIYGGLMEIFNLLARNSEVFRSIALESATYER